MQKRAIRIQRTCSENTYQKGRKEYKNVTCELPSGDTLSASCWPLFEGAQVQINIGPLLWSTFSKGGTRVAKCHRYGRYICVKISKSWGKKIVGIQNRYFFGHNLTTTVAFFVKTAFKIHFLVFLPLNLLHMPNVKKPVAIYALFLGVNLVGEKWSV